MLSREHIEHVLKTNYDERIKSRKIGVARTFHPNGMLAAANFGSQVSPQRTPFKDFAAQGLARRLPHAIKTAAPSRLAIQPSKPQTSPANCRRYSRSICPFNLMPGPPDPNQHSLAFVVDSIASQGNFVMAGGPMSMHPTPLAGSIDMMVCQPPQSHHRSKQIKYSVMQTRRLPTQELQRNSQVFSKVDIAL